MPKFTKEYYLKKYMKCFEELQSSACDICSNCVYLHKERFTPIIYQDFRLKNIGLGLFEKCNIHCVYCGEAPQNYSNVIDMRKVLNRLISEDLVGPETQLILANGEPTIHKYFEDLLTRAFKMNMRIQVRTNGVVFNNLLYQYLKSDKVSINISIDSGTRETYLKIKRAERFDVVWENIKKYCATGGETMIYPNIWHVINKLGKYSRVYVSSNMTICNKNFWENLIKSNLYRISISIDSLNFQLNDLVRGNSEKVINNTMKLLSVIKKEHLKLKVKINCVITKLNIFYITDLLKWAYEIGIDTVSCQPVTLSTLHPYYKLLSLENLSYEESQQIEKIYELEKQLFTNGYTDVFSNVVNTYLDNNNLLVKNCFDNTAKYISADGKLYSCPCERFLLYDFNRMKEYNLKQNERCKFSLQCMTNLKRLPIASINNNLSMN